MNKILIIEDEESIRNLLRITLESNQYQIYEAESGTFALNQLFHLLPDLIILDLGLPDIPGLTLITEIRKKYSIPIIVLTVQDSDADKVLALDGGADDYLTKPFSTPELLVRIRVALRHSKVIPLSLSELKCGPIFMDQQAHIVKVDDHEVRLSATEYKILQILLLNKGRVVLHSKILNEVWGPNAMEHVHYLRVYLANLRKKIKSKHYSKDLISTDAGVGYRLVDPDEN